jgi:hypothetical protein
MLPSSLFYENFSLSPKELCIKYLKDVDNFCTEILPETTPQPFRSYSPAVYKYLHNNELKQVKDLLKKFREKFKGIRLIRNLCKEALDSLEIDKVFYGLLYGMTMEFDPIFLDFEFYECAKELNKKLYSLETPEEQLEFIKIRVKDKMKYLRMLLRSDYFRRLEKLWKGYLNGEENIFDLVLREPFYAKIYKRDETIYQRARPFIKRKSAICIGLAHLPGIIRKLKRNFIIIKEPYV